MALPTDPIELISLAQRVDARLSLKDQLEAQLSDIERELREFGLEEEEATRLRQIYSQVKNITSS